ncbi:MAG: hypothetical protein Ct9H90mP9_6200 [Pseudomonadota bacterium]|nr:MAG: hypothetical protein Ct9H90mP9_6200 [Pseudomonadota bacterium]
MFVSTRRPSNRASVSWGPNSGLMMSPFSEETKKTGVTGICGSGIIEAIAELYLCGIISQDGLFDESMMGRSNRIIKEGRTCSYLLHTGEPELRITQNDIRAIQLAKAALYAGIRLLMDHLGIEEVQRIRACRSFWQPHRCEIRDDSRLNSRLRSRPCEFCRKCRRNGCKDGIAES